MESFDVGLTKSKNNGKQILALFVQCNIAFTTVSRVMAALRNSTLHSSGAYGGRLSSTGHDAAEAGAAGNAPGQGGAGGGAEEARAGADGSEGSPEGGGGRSRSGGGQDEGAVREGDQPSAGVPGGGQAGTPPPPSHSLPPSLHPSCLSSPSSLPSPSPDTPQPLTEGCGDKRPHQGRCTLLCQLGHMFSIRRCATAAPLKQPVLLVVSW